MFAHCLDGEKSHWCLVEAVKSNNWQPSFLRTMCQDSKRSMDKDCDAVVAFFTETEDDEGERHGWGTIATDHVKFSSFREVKNVEDLKLFMLYQDECLHQSLATSTSMSCTSMSGLSMSSISTRSHSMSKNLTSNILISKIGMRNVEMSSASTHNVSMSKI